MAVRLEKALGSTAETWVQMQMNYDLAQIRRRASSIRVKRIAPRRTGKAA
jgi:plasmid maintenance system antidote protein VapI